MKLITGATGRIGNVLVKALNKRGEPVRVLIRKTSNCGSLEGSKIEIVYGDIRDPNSLVKAFRGVDEVFHLAGHINISAYDEKLTMDTNVSGTQNVLAACKQGKVRRFLYASSIHAFSLPPGNQVITEETSLCTDEPRGIYDRSKALATEAVRKAAADGLNAVVVHPTGVTGPFDYRPSFFGAGMISSVKSGLKTTIGGAYDYVDVRDVVAGMIAAFDKGQTGESYILGGEELTMSHYAELLKQLAGIEAKTRILDYATALVVAKISSFFNRKSQITPYSLETLNSNCNISHQKAFKELGYKPMPIDSSIKDQYEWFRKHKML